MNNWTTTMIERLDSAYQVRFEKEAVLVFLNDAYQNALMLRKESLGETNTAMEGFLAAFNHTRDLFISQVVDRYPSSYTEVAQQIAELKQLNLHLTM